MRGTGGGDRSRRTRPTGARGRPLPLTPNPRRKSAQRRTAPLERLARAPPIRGIARVPFFVGRSGKRGADRWLHWRVGLFAGGALLYLTALYLDRDWLVSVAIGILAVGLVAGIIARLSKPEGGEGREKGR